MSVIQKLPEIAQPPHLKVWLFMTMLQASVTMLGKLIIFGVVGLIMKRNLSDTLQIKPFFKLMQLCNNKLFGDIRHCISNIIKYYSRRVDRIQLNV